MLSPESANFIPIRSHDPDNDSIKEPRDVTELDVANSSVESEMLTGIDSIDNKLRQSNMSILSRYKVRADLSKLAVLYRIYSPQAHTGREP